MGRLAYTLVELVIVVMILGILAAVAAPSLLEVTGDVEITAAARHLLVLTDAAERYYLINGSWPANTFAGQMPPELNDFLRKGAFDGNPLGGYWDWSGPGSGIAKIGPSLLTEGQTAEQAEGFQKIDAAIDDSNLSTGNIQQFLFAGYYILVVILAED